MNYQVFRKVFDNYRVFSVSEIRKRFPDFDSRRLNEWQKKDLIFKIRNSWYCFPEFKNDSRFLYFVANKIYAPSYISFESALEYYNLIPEAVFSIVSATSRINRRFQNPFGQFEYRHIKSNLMFGYKLIPYNSFIIKIAEPEKALLDYLYINSRAKSNDFFNGLRLNKDILRGFDKNILEQNTEIFRSKALDHRVKKLLIWLNA